MRVVEASARASHRSGHVRSLIDRLITFLSGFVGKALRLGKQIERSQQNGSPACEDVQRHPKRLLHARLKRRQSTVSILKSVVTVL